MIAVSRYPVIGTAVPSPAARTGQKSGILKFLVGAYAALLPYQVGVTSDMNFAVANCGLLLILLLAPGQLQYRKPAWTIWHLAMVFVFAIGTLVSALNTGYLTRYVFLNKDTGLLLLLLSYAAITSAAAEWEDVRHILRVFTVGVVAQNLVAIGAFLAAYFFGVDTPLTSYGGLRLSGMMLDANAYGGLLVVALVICEGASWGPAPLFKGFPLMFCRLTLGLGILFTFSRSAWVSLTLALLLLCVVRRQVALRVALVGLIGAPCLFLVMGRRFLQFFESMAARPEEGESRFKLAHDALTEFARHPFVGGGLGSFISTEGTIVHNTFLWFLADFGILGLIVLLGYFGSLSLRAWFAYKVAPDSEKPIMIALLLAQTAMMGLAMGIEAFFQMHWWLVMALIASGYSIVCRQPNQVRKGPVSFLTRQEYKR
jgi:putative inorganic carbon (HCO3(-)) transporter